MVRQRMITPKLEGLYSALFIGLLLILASCNNITSAPSAGASAAATKNVDGWFDNKAYVYKDSPYILAGANYSDRFTNIATFLDKTPEFITDNPQLTANCLIEFNYLDPLFGVYIQYPNRVDDCIQVLNSSDETQPIVRNSNRTYIFSPGTSEFYQVNTMYHLQKAKDSFFKKLQFAYDNIHSLDYRMPKSVPTYLKDSQFYWFNGVANTNAQSYRNSFITAYSACDDVLSAYFAPIGPTLCFGIDKTRQDFRVVQDPSVIYHEFGHAAVAIMLNLRNGTGFSSHPLRSSFTNLGYDEAGAINEGLADYLSYIVTKRPSMGEWFGKPSKQSRPMTEDDPRHIPVLDTTPEGRLSYPQYLLYDPNYPDSPEEDVHYAGSIVAHYLVAFTESLKTHCSLTGDSDGGHDRATSYAMLVLAETLSEIGDLYARGVDDNLNASQYASTTDFFTNLDETNSFLWTQHVNQTNYRRFFQIWAKNTNKYITGNICSDFTRDESEKLLDDYGLLLFKTYNDNGNSTKSRLVYYEDMVAPGDMFIHRGVPPTQVSEDNRRKSVLVSKDLLNLATDVDSTNVNFYIIDNRTDVAGLLKTILYKGMLLPLSNKVASVDYNNSNIKISPGEIVALIPNLFNSSNTTMAGVQLLASDWDHVHVTSTTSGNFKPCVVDTKTTIDQGGEDAQTCTSTYQDYQRLVADPVTKLFPTDASAPVCLVQYDDGVSTRWVSQNEFRKKNGLNLLDKDCLGFSTSGNSEPDFGFSPHECLARFLPGANEAFFSKIEPQQTYYNSVVKTSREPRFNSGNLLVMEVNKWVPPGTKFRCRMRARFSNCSDCYADSTNNDDDYLDSELNGAKPYKVINFEFVVND
jgi:hypothetical protein